VASSLGVPLLNLLPIATYWTLAIEAPLTTGMWFLRGAAAPAPTERPHSWGLQSRSPSVLSW